MSDVDVLVVGAGPAGLTLAIDLLRRGKSVRIIDQAPTGFPGSRAKGLQPRTLEVFEDLGVLPTVLERSTHYPLMGIHAGPVTVPWMMIRRHRRTTSTPYPDTLLLPQFETDRILAARVEELGGEIDYAARLVSLVDGSDEVQVVAEAGGRERQLTARYVVGADGGASTVRKQAGIPFTGETDAEDRMIIADVEVPGLSRKRWHIWPRAAGRFVGLCPLPGTDLFQLMIRLHPDDDPSLDPEQIAARVREVTGKAGITLGEMTWSSVFRPNVRLADRYRQGHILLAGDAAHVHTPAGAQGLNTGVQDSYNLGWKLAQVLDGASDTLLDTYEEERRPVAARVLGLSSALYESLATSKLAAARRGDEERQLSLSYRGGPLAPGVDAKGNPAGPGDRAPNVQFRDVHGVELRLFDLLQGPHFTLLSPPTAGPAPAWPSSGAPLEVIRLDARGARSVASAFGQASPAAILIRPDGYIAAITPESRAVVDGDPVRLMLPAS